MIRPYNAFKLVDRPLTSDEVNKLEKENKPMVHIVKQYGKYKTLEIDFITCDWCISPIGQSRLQSRLNMEVIFMWLRGFNLKLNQNNIGSMICILRGDDLAISYLINEMNSLTLIEDCWIKYRERNKKLNVERTNENDYVKSVSHPKGNTNKIV